MKNGTLSLLLLLVIVSFACEADTVQTASKDVLIAKLLDSPDVLSAKKDGKIVIVEFDFCKEFDCEEYFKKYKKGFQFYSKEDAFMRAITNFVMIEDIADDNSKMRITVKNKGEQKEIEL